MVEERDGITSPGRLAGGTPPPGHSKLCFARGQGVCRRGRGWEDFADTQQRAREGLAGGTVECTCRSRR